MSSARATSGDPSSWPSAPGSPDRPTGTPAAGPMADSAPWPLASPAADPARPVASVLFVCTGNVCRSPFDLVQLRGAALAQPGGAA